MNNFMKSTMVGLVVLALGLIGWMPPVSAGVFKLENWNVTELDASDDVVQVRTANNCNGTDTICVVWDEGTIVEGPSAIGIDMFFFDVSTANGDAVGAATSVSGADVAWSFNFDGGQADGFGSFDSLKNSGPANSTLNLIFTVPGSDSLALDEFAAHVRYRNSCSGFVSNRTVSAGSIGSDANCGAVVPEPAPLGLMAIGMLGLLFVGRWTSRRT